MDNLQCYPEFTKRHKIDGGTEDLVSIGIYGFGFSDGKASELILPSRALSKATIKPRAIIDLTPETWAAIHASNPYAPDCQHIPWQHDTHDNILSLTGVNICPSNITGVEYDQNSIQSAFCTAKLISSNQIPIIRIDGHQQPTDILVKITWHIPETQHESARAAEIRAKRYGRAFEDTITTWSGALAFRRTGHHQLPHGADIWVIPLKAQTNQQQSQKTA